MALDWSSGRTWLDECHWDWSTGDLTLGTGPVDSLASSDAECRVPSSEFNPTSRVHLGALHWTQVNRVDRSVTGLEELSTKSWPGNSLLYVRQWWCFDELRYVLLFVIEMAVHWEWNSWIWLVALSILDRVVLLSNRTSCGFNWCLRLYPCCYCTIVSSHWKQQVVWWYRWKYCSRCDPDRTCCSN